MSMFKKNSWGAANLFGNQYSRLFSNLFANVMDQQCDMMLLYQIPFCP